MKRCALLLFAFLVPLSVIAQAGKPCEELKSEIAMKLEANGVKTYSLDIVAKDKDADGKVIGTCEGGSKKIVYRKTAITTQTTPKHQDQSSQGR